MFIFDNVFLLSFSTQSIIFTMLLFMWAGFVRSGLGFGGAALALPLMLFIYDQPLFWMPVIGAHLLFFSALTLRTRIHNVDWGYLKKAAYYVVPAALVGVFGLITLPSQILVYFIYGITLCYALIWVLNIPIRSNRGWMDKFFLLLGGYVAGTSLTGAPLMVAVFMRNVSRSQLRNTMFVLWFIVVSIKMITFLLVHVPLHFASALLLIPAASVGHVLGLRAHDYILQNDQRFKQVVGGFLLVICVLGIAHNF
jgi:uncharacterized membrane protein YfcA